MDDMDSSRARPGRATLAEVAALAGVAPSTASRAFSRPGKVAPATAERVFAAARTLGYRDPGEPRGEAPRRRGGSLRNVIAVVVSDVTNAPYARLMRGAQEMAEDEGFSAVLVDAIESGDHERLLLARLVDDLGGVLLSSSRMPDEAILTLARQLPVVVLHRIVPGVPSVIEDVASGIRELVRHLVDLGHTSIAYVPGPRASYAESLRWRDVLDESRRAGLRAKRLEGFAPTFQGGVAAVEAWLERPTTAIVAYNDEIAGGVLRGLGQHGLSVPGDVSVAGMDNTPLSSVTAPRLTTLAIPHHGLGRVGAQQLVSRIRGAATSGEPVLRVSTRLIVRDSTGTPSPPSGPVSQRSGLT